MMNPSIEEVTRWLQSKSNHTLHISKQEEKDQDQIKIQLERFEHQRHQEQSIDGYGDRHALLFAAPALSSRPAMKRRAKRCLRHWTGRVNGRGHPGPSSGAHYGSEYLFHHDNLKSRRNETARTVRVVQL